jgi:hypothetical protein
MRAIALERPLLWEAVEVPMLRRELVFLALGTALGSCGTGREAVKPDDMSAAQHRAEAARENEAARRRANDYHPHASVPSPFSPAAGVGPSEAVAPPAVYNPTEVELRRADTHRAHARQHERAAQELERFEAAECVGFPPAARAACPLLRPVARIEDLGNGVRVTFAAGSPVHAIHAHMRCHYAYARTRAFDDAASCPLYVRGIDIKRGPDPLSIDITTDDWQQVQALRTRSRAEVVYAPGAGR